MLDPVGPCPAWLVRLTQPIADTFSLTTLPLHAHEVLFTFTCYHIVNSFVSPYLSAKLFPKIYPNLSRKTKVNWHAHVVSMCHALTINTLALWVLFADEERREMGRRERVWGYTGAGGMIQGLATGYFLWDIMITGTHMYAFGIGMLAHAVCALIVFSFGFRPFVNFYGPTFILYELSSPFLNAHWYFDKLGLTGSRYQLYNGLALLATFFSCRLVWGTYQSVRVYQDVWAALHTPGNGSPWPTAAVAAAAGHLKNATTLSPATTAAQAEIMRFYNTGPQSVPIWLAVIYLGSNMVLNTLNFYWFGKMIKAVKKRFDGSSDGPPPDKRAAGEKGEKAEDSDDDEGLLARSASVDPDTVKALGRDVAEGINGAVVVDAEELRRRNV